MYNVMKNDQSVLVDENHEGLARAQNENYAYLMESTSLNYYTERICNVTMVGDLIDDRNYAIGMRKSYKYYNTLSEGVLRLQERGVMDKLHTKWWKAKRGGGACQVGFLPHCRGNFWSENAGVFLPAPPLLEQRIDFYPKICEKCIFWEIHCIFIDSHLVV